MTLNAKNNKPRVNYNSTGEKMSEEKSDENSYYSNTRKNIFNVYPRESLFFFRQAHKKLKIFSCLWRLYISYEPAYASCVWTGIYDWYVMIFMSLFYSSKQGL